MSDEGKLFVGGLNFDTTEETLASEFSKHGKLQKVEIIRDRETGQPRGFGFVTYEHPGDVKDAMEAMHGKIIDGRTIRVDEAGKGRSRGGRFNSGGRGGGYGGRNYGGYGGRNYGGYGGRSYDDRS